MKNEIIKTLEKVLNQREEKLASLNTPVNTSWNLGYDDSHYAEVVKAEIESLKAQIEYIKAL